MALAEAVSQHAEEAAYVRLLCSHSIRAPHYALMSKRDSAQLFCTEAWTRRVMAARRNLEARLRHRGRSSSNAGK